MFWNPVFTINRSTIAVVALVGLALLTVGMLWLYLDERGVQGMLADVECEALLPTAFEMQGEQVMVSREQTCSILRMVAAMKPLDDRHSAHESAGDPDHYFGRMRIRPVDDVWFLIFTARASEGFRPAFSLRHRRGAGWAVVGRFDAMPVLRLLRLEGRPDSAALRSPASLTPIDQTLPMR